MLRLALLSGRGRLGTFTGALVALCASSALVMAGAMPLEAAAGAPGRTVSRFTPRDWMLRCTSS